MFDFFPPHNLKNNIIIYDFEQSQGSEKLWDNEFDITF